MGITDDLKNEIRFFYCCGEYEKSLRILLKIKMAGLEYRNIEDEIDINHMFACNYFKINNNPELLNYYLDLNTCIFENEKTRNEKLLSYYKHLWLNTEAKKDIISKEEYIKNFTEIYKYYSSEEVNSIRFAEGARQQIVFHTGTDDDVINYMEEMIIKYGTESTLVNDMVVDCKNRNDYTYIQVKKLLDFYSMDKNII